MNDGFRLEEQRFPNAGLAVSYVRNIGVIPAGLFTICNSGENTRGNDDNWCNIYANRININ